MCGETCLNLGEFGGGLRNLGTASLYRVRVTNNRTLLNTQNLGGHGGGIHNASVLYLEDCEITENQTTGNRWNAHGAGLNNFYNATATMTRTLFQRNKVAVPQGGGGGAIFNWPGGSVIADDSRFLDNEAGQFGQANNDGGGVSNYGTFVLRRSVLARNRNWGGGAGGGILNRGSLTLINDTLSANISTGDGGGVATDPVFSIRNSTFFRQQLWWRRRWFQRPCRCMEQYSGRKHGWLRS